ncbi:hypothetical protein KIPB_011774 [Kipferlia bialata]|uniref:Uncharacterized protein n=1 Tax=Kipferlia bialata TaxID=797122 RepID=A0A9K3D807_9EUKA|nr:hypothetical protein KIPB_011774 [Kipferlia bialata]|eukprot:g11774.t1
MLSSAVIGRLTEFLYTDVDDASDSDDECGPCECAPGEEFDLKRTLSDMNKFTSHLMAVNVALANRKRSLSQDYSWIAKDPKFLAADEAGKFKS